jgi:hypothetical protein
MSLSDAVRCCATLTDSLEKSHPACTDAHVALAPPQQAAAALTCLTECFELHDNQQQSSEQSCKFTAYVTSLFALVSSASGTLAKDDAAVRAMVHAAVHAECGACLQELLTQWLKLQQPDWPATDDFGPDGVRAAIELASLPMMDLFAAAADAPLSREQLQAALVRVPQLLPQQALQQVQHKITELLAAGACIDSTSMLNSCAATVLSKMVACSSAEGVRWLVAVHKAQLIAPPEEAPASERPLLCTWSRGADGIAVARVLLIELGADLLGSIAGLNAVHYALHNGAVQLAAELLCAVYSKHGAAEVTRLLQQIDVSTGRTAVHTVVLLNGTAELLSAVSSVPLVVAAVAAAAAAVAVQDKAGNTALHTAACSETAQDLVALLACYASSSDKQAALAVKNSAGMTVTALALCVGVPECVAAVQQYSKVSHHQPL